VKVQGGGSFGRNSALDRGSNKGTKAYCQGKNTELTKFLPPVPPWARPINMMFQSYALFSQISVADNIAYGLKRAGPPADMRRRHVSALAFCAIIDSCVFCL
jgi:putrescine transport system ATP-binding protein